MKHEPALRGDQPRSNEPRLKKKVRMTADPSYEISTDEYLSVVGCAIPARIGLRFYRPEALSYEQSRGQK
jgi:hypothetical protein